MRHLIVFPGNSIKNKVWGELMLKHFGGRFDSAFMPSYDHWESGEVSIDFQREEEKIRQHVATLPSETQITILAKSVGSLLAFMSIAHGVITPIRCVFFGIPFDVASGTLFKESWESIDSFKVPATVFHNVEDPTASYEFTKTTLTSHVPHVKFVTTYEADHWYGDVAIYEKSLPLT